MNPLRATAFAAIMTCQALPQIQRRIFLLALCSSVFAARPGSAQEKAPDTIPSGSLTVHVRSFAEPISGAVVRAGSIGTLTDSTGNAKLRLSAGPQTVIVSRLGFIPDTVSIEITPAADTSIDVQLSPAVTRLAAVIVGASRVERRVQDEPERVEVLSGEDVGEKTIMRPANPTNLVSEMPGVRVQTTSPALGGAGIRLQGLRGRYTLLLADGLPLYGSSSEGLGFLQIPPLDLAQAEVIKGAATALYGPAAAGGVVNLVSRRPPRGRRGVHEILLNQTSRRGTDGLVWSGAKLSKQWGYTLLGGAHHQTAIDVDGDGWADIPNLRRFEIRPRAFWTDSLGSSAMITGLEIFYTGRQALNDDPYRTSSVPYTTVSLLIEQRVGSATVFLNGEDLTGVRQTRFDPLLLPSQDPTGRWTTPEWAPLDGRTLNVGVRAHF